MTKSNLLTEITRMRVIMGLVENTQLADKLYFKTGKLNNDVRDAILNITGGDNYTKLVADLYYHFNNFSDSKDGVDTNLIRMVEDFYDDLISYDNKIFPFTKNLNDFGADKPNNYHVLTLAEVLKSWHKLAFEWSKLPSIFKRNLSNEIKEMLFDGTHTIDTIRFKYDEISKILSRIRNIWGTIPPKKREEITPMLVNSKKKLNDLLETLTNIQGTLSYITPEMVDKDVLLDKAENLNVNIVLNTDNVIVFKINDYEAMQEMGCYSSWCFSQAGSEHHWDSYAQFGYVYLIYNLTVDVDDSRFLMVFLPDSGELYLSNNVSYNNVYGDDTGYLYLMNLGIDVNKLV